MILDEDMKFNSTSVPLEEMQLLQSRIFNRVELAAFLGMTPDRVGIFEKAATFKSLDATEVRHVKDAIHPPVARFESAIDRQLLGRWHRKKPSQIYCKFDFREILRGDPKVRAETQEIGRRWGWLNADEIRAEDDRNPIGGRVGSQYIIAENYRPADLPYPEHRRGDRAGGEGGAEAIVEPGVSRATARAALHQAFLGAVERLEARERMALAGGVEGVTWYRERLRVESVAGELLVACRVGAALGARKAEGLDAYASERANLYIASRVREAEADQARRPSPEIADIETQAFLEDPT